MTAVWARRWGIEVLGWRLEARLVAVVREFFQTVVFCVWGRGRREDGLFAFGFVCEEKISWDMAGWVVR